MNTLKILWDNEEWDRIIMFDGITVHLTNEFGGGYITHLAVSDLSFRTNFPNHDKAFVEIQSDVLYTHFIISDDYGKKRTMSIPNTLSEEINTAKVLINKHRLIKPYLTQIQ